MSTRLFVGNLPDNTSENDLRSAFSSYGEIATLDLKTKSATCNENKKFAFVSLSGSNYDIEACIRHFTNEDFNGNRLYVTRARESFLERLQRERDQAQQKKTEKLEPQILPTKNPPIKLNEKLNPRKRKFDIEDENIHKPGKQERMDYVSTKHKTNDHPGKDIFEFEKHADSTNKPKPFINNTHTMQNGDEMKVAADSVVDKKKHDSDMKRMESMKKKRQEFKEKKMIIKTGLTAVDKVQNKKIVFSDNEDDTPQSNGHSKAIKRKGTLFNDEDSDDHLDFAIKEQFEGKKGQKVLDLQSRYKSDKRFTLDERFIDDDKSEDENNQDEESEIIELEQKDEKNKQLDILQDVLGITLKRKIPQDDTKNKPKLGMLRFDPSQPEHARFLAPVESKKQEPKKGKKKLKEQEVQPNEQRPEEVRPEVSKEQFYKVSEALKEAIAQPNTFSLRSLFGNSEIIEEEPKEDENYISLEAPKQPKVKNPLETKDKNPFVYDSSESENEDEPERKTEGLPGSETKAVWKENLFFGDADQRLKEALVFFNNSSEEAHKERRELKSLVKKRIYNKERKNQMFQKKIGGRRKTMKKSFRKKT